MSLYQDNKELLEAMTYKQARKHLATFGISLVFNEEYNEYRMNKGNREATAYYTDDLQDAIGTAYAEYIDKRS